MRERHGLTYDELMDGRITPAYAGKTELNKLKVSASEDHPRVCGKDPKKWILRTHKLGSPPRMRERRGTAATFIEKHRITPAYAGKTVIDPPF